MWPFCRKKKGKLNKIVAGIVIGGAIGSIVGKTLIDRSKEHEKDEDELDEDEEE